MKKIISISFLLCFILIVSANAGEKYIFATKWNYSNDSRTLWMFPEKIAVDHSGFVYTICNNFGLMKFDSSGNFIGNWKGYRRSSGSTLYGVYDFTVTPSGYIYAVTSFPNIVKFDTNFNMMRIITPTDIDANWQLSNITIDSSNNIYGIYTNGAYSWYIVKINSDGITQWKKYGGERIGTIFPKGIAINSSGNIYVTDTGNNRILKFDSNGNPAAPSFWGRSGSRSGEFNKPWFLTVGADDRIYVADYNNYRIQKFDSNGTYITKWGGRGEADGQFKEPMGVAVDASGNVYVADRGNARIQKFNKIFEIEREVIPLVPIRAPIR